MNRTNISKTLYVAKKKEAKRVVEAAKKQNRDILKKIASRNADGVRRSTR